MTTIKARDLTCPCGTVFTSRELNARYCSKKCRHDFSRYGRSYGNVPPKTFSVYRNRG